MPKLLILSSNPKRDLNLDREVSDLTNTVQRLGDLEVVLGLGVRSQELQELLAEHSPQFVHFCGHGAGEKGLVVQDENGREQLLSTEILTGIFKNFADEINCIILNACDSLHQAVAIANYINFVIGMSGRIEDKAALQFSVGFYKGLATRKSIEQAYEMGCIAIQIWWEAQSQTTQSLQYRDLSTVKEGVQSESLSRPEYLKPILLKDGIRWTSDKTKDVSAQKVCLEEFVSYVKQEIDRKDYKDKARAAYDNFGRNSAHNATTFNQFEYEQRKRLLKKVKEFWIEGFLNPSLQDFPIMQLDLKARPDAIADLTQGIEALSVELDASYEQLRTTQIYQDLGQGRTLLILGEPGAGKTIALLQLLERLVKRSEENLSLPIPIVFNLSSWAKDRKAIVDWLIDELREKYQVPKSWSQRWITQQQFILLLDGLDEVNQNHRNGCALALNKFIGLFQQTEVAVCCRVRDYEALDRRLQISSALCLLPLSPQQIYMAIDRAGGLLDGLKVLLKSNTELEQFAQTPLIFNFMSIAYQGWSIEKLIPQFRATSDRQRHLFDTYIDRRLERGAASEYPKHRVLHWLKWLASRMVQEKQTIFLIEKMQPIWLQNRNKERFYRIQIFIFSGLIVGIYCGAITGIVLEPINTEYSLQLWSYLIDNRLPFELSVLQIFMLTSGLISGLIAGLIASLSREISPLEKLTWSLKNAIHKFVPEFIAGIAYGFLGGLLGGLLAGASVGALFGVIIGISCGLFFLLGSGLGSSEITRRTVPNQGIWTSLQNSLIIGLTSTLISGLIFKLILGMQNYGIMFGLISGIIFGMKYGGVACIQHFTLREMLYLSDDIP